MLDPDTVASMIRWCGEGPPFASVEHVEVRDEPPIGERDFRVAR
jgi:acylphosphatase